MTNKISHERNKSDNRNIYYVIKQKFGGGNKLDSVASQLVTNYGNSYRLQDDNYHY